MNRDWLIARARERSTWTGIVGLLTAFGVGIQPAAAEQLVALGTAAGSLIWIVTKG